MIERGKFITFEGPEGSGKSTQIKILNSYLRMMDYPVVLTREPGGTTTGEAIRRLLQHDSTDAEMSDRTEVLLFQASRAQIVQEVIKPALEMGKHVLCDRYTDSSAAYQGNGRGFKVEEIEGLSFFATGGLAPDLTLLLDISIDAAFKRLANRGYQDRIERAEKAFHERVRNGYLDLAKKYSNRFAIINGDQSPEIVQADIQKTVKERLGIG